MRAIFFIGLVYKKVVFVGKMFFFTKKHSQHLHVLKKVRTFAC